MAAAAACGVSAAFGAAAYEIRARLDARPTLAAITAPAGGPSTGSPASRRTRAMHRSRPVTIQTTPETLVETAIEPTNEPTITPGVDTKAGPITATTIDTATTTDPAAGSTRAQHRDTARGELRLLRQARDNVARGDYAGALAPITRHARRYGYVDGRLVEEREALRIKALAGLGRAEDAQRAASAFQARFPQSVLLPVISRLIVAAP